MDYDVDSMSGLMPVSSSWSLLFSERYVGGTDWGQSMAPPSCAPMLCSPPQTVFLLKPTSSKYPLLRVGENYGEIWNEGWDIVGLHTVDQN